MHHEQVRITGDDQLGACGDRGGDDMSSAASVGTVRSISPGATIVASAARKCV